MARAHELTSFADRVEMQRYAERGRTFLNGLTASSAPVPVLDEPAAPQPRRIVTVHSRYGRPPGDLAYIDSSQWTSEQVEVANRWLRNEQAKDWWRAQAAAQRAA